MTFDLVVRGGTVLDGSGAPRFGADIGVVGDTIAAVGSVTERGREEVLADGLFVAPGFIDGHTHMDAQVFWDPLGTCPSWHGVTTAIMGNCGFTLAPVRPGAEDLAVRSIERAEDMSRAVLAAGVPWNWETIADYLDAVDRTPKGINYAVYVGHSTLRSYVMGERAFTDRATDDDVDQMRRLLRDGLAAGAIGLSSSLTHHHQTVAGTPVASVIADRSELDALVSVLGEERKGIFQFAPGWSTDPAEYAEFEGWLTDVAIRVGRPITFLTGAHPQALSTAATIARAGGTVRAQVHAHELVNVLSFRTHLPFDALPGWSALRAEPLPRQRALLADPAVREPLVAEAMAGPYRSGVGAELRAPNFETIRVLSHALPPYPTVADVARREGSTPVDVMIDASLAADFEPCLLQPFIEIPDDALLAGIRHPYSVVAGSDSGAHVSQIMDSSIPTYLLGHWVRSREEITWEQAIQLLTAVPAHLWGLSDRGLVRPGYRADIVVFDPDTVAPALPTVAHDLPASGPRLVQHSTGLHATVVNGRVLYRNGAATGELPGRLLRL